MTEPETCPNKRFLQVLRDHSTNQTDPIEEWDLLGFVSNGGATHCICDTQIILNYCIQHKQTKKQLMIGSECVKRWINPKLVCERCQTTLGCVMKRIRYQDFHCRQCKKALQEEKAYQEHMKAQQLRRWERELFYAYGKHYEQPFKEVAKDIPFVEKLLNLPPEKRWQKNLIAFLTYVSLLYEIADVEVEM